MLIDSHVHLDVAQFEEDREEVIARARAVGIELMLEIAGSDIGAGSLPVDCGSPRPTRLFMRPSASTPKQVLRRGARNGPADSQPAPQGDRLGEIGLDFHYDHSPREVQRRVFAGNT
jgi:TatD DNase family protein